MSDNIYPKGMYVKEPRQGAPEFVKGSISIKVADLHEWLNTNQGLANDAGYINFDILSGKDGWYTKVNTYKPKSEMSSTPPKKEYYSKDGGEDTFVPVEEVPF